MGSLRLLLHMALRDVVKSEALVHVVVVLLDGTFSFDVDWSTSATDQREFGEIKGASSSQLILGFLLDSWEIESFFVIKWSVIKRSVIKWSVVDWGVYKWALIKMLWSI